MNERNNMNNGIIERNPLKRLKKLLNQRITFKMKDGHELTGTLIESDCFMNCFLKDVEEKMKNEVVNQFESVYIRGLGIVCIYI